MDPVQVLEPYRRLIADVRLAFFNERRDYLQKSQED